MAEVGSAFTQEGGPYEWSKMAFGRLQGAIAAVLYWVTNPLWVGGSLAFIATEAWNDNIFKIHAGGGRRLPLQVPLHLALDRRRHRLAQARQVDPERRRAHAHRRPGLLHDHHDHLRHRARRGTASRSATSSRPASIFLALVPLLLFNYVGFELQNGAAEEMEDPQKDVPLSILRSGVIGVLLYAIPIFAILIVLPAEKVTGIGGFLDAVDARPSASTAARRASCSA